MQPTVISAATDVTRLMQQLQQQKLEREETQAVRETITKRNDVEPSAELPYRGKQINTKA
ncbi:MAG: hypothetical protein ISR91_05530 [Candidatus Delongbacteria bacterium]|nr:hypothetical protein [Candidatus Delongbacteria bacterium]